MRVARPHGLAGSRRDRRLRRRRASVPAISDDPIALHPAVRALVALTLGVGLGILAGLFIPRRRGE